MSKCRGAEGAERAEGVESVCGACAERAGLPHAALQQLTQLGGAALQPAQLGSQPARELSRRQLASRLAAPTAAAAAAAAGLVRAPRAERALGHGERARLALLLPRRLGAGGRGEEILVSAPPQRERRRGCWRALSRWAHCSLRGCRRDASRRADIAPC